MADETNGKTADEIETTELVRKIRELEQENEKLKVTLFLSAYNKKKTVIHSNSYQKLTMLFTTMYIIVKR